MPAQRLLAFLALQNHAVLRSYVAGTLWIDSPEDRALGSLRSALWRLPHLGCDLVEATCGELLLAPEVTVDVRQAIARAHQLIDNSSELENADLDEALLSGELLPDWYEDWVLLEREHFRELRVRALESLCCRLAAVGRFGQAMEAGLAAVKTEPLRESAHRLLIRVQLAEGNRAEALHQYRLYRQLLHDHLGLEPSRHMEELVQSLKRREPAGHRSSMPRR